MGAHTNLLPQAPTSLGLVGGLALLIKTLWAVSYKITLGVRKKVKEKVSFGKHFCDCRLAWKWTGRWKLQRADGDQRNCEGRARVLSDV